MCMFNLVQKMPTIHPDLRVMLFVVVRSGGVVELLLLCFSF